MKNKKFFVVAFLLVSTTALFGQMTNIFLDRNYWKTNPTISAIETKIEQGNDITALNGSAFDAVCYAILENTDNATIKHLLSKPGNEVNKLTHDGRTYLFWAAYKGNLEIMEYLVAHGAKTNVIDSYGNTVITFAAGAGQTQPALYDFLTKHGANLSTEVNRGGANALLLAAPYVSNFSELDYFIKNGIDINSTDSSGNGVFNYAAKGGNIELLNTLIKAGVPYKNLNSKGGNAMLFASQGKRGFQNKFEMYLFLDKIGVTANIVGANGRNPLHTISSNSDDLETLKFFIDKGVDVNLKDNDGHSPFMNAVSRNNLEIVKYLFTYVKDINAKDENGRSALAFAINSNDMAIAEFLIEKGADITTVDKDGNTLAYYLMNTFRSDNPEQFNQKLALLQKNGFDISLNQNKNNNLYHIAVDKNNLELLKRVQSFNIDINAKNDEGMTPLHLAAMKANDKVILEYLVANGADKSVKTDFEESVFDLASENELLKKGNIDISFLK
jgi:ankyrin repeat protein